MEQPSTARGYTVHARSTDTFGRVLCSTRNHHFILDGPVQNGCPGEAVTPAEMFLAAIAGCGVELVQALARDAQVALRSVQVQISGLLDRSRPVRSDLTVFNSVTLQFRLAGVTAAQGGELIERFKGR
jgi:uncharacterized OsmC-like protein